MIISVCQIEQFLFEVAPAELRQSWDNVGLLVGDPAAPAEKVLVALDITRDVVEEAVEGGFSLIVAHHPVMNCAWHPVQTVRPDNDQGWILTTLIQNRIAAICMHTNLDSAPGGVNDVPFSCDGYNSPKITTTSKEYQFTGDAKGEISIKWTQPNRTYVYIKSISVEYNNGETQQTQTLSFPESSYTVTPHTPFEAPELDGAKTSVTYSSSQPEVATVNANTGAVSIVGLGTTVIRATAEENEEYFAATAEYTLHVKWPNNQAVFDLRHPEYFGIPIPESGNESPVEKTLLAGDIRLLNGGTGIYRMRFWIWYMSKFTSVFYNLNIF